VLVYLNREDAGNLFRYLLSEKATDDFIRQTLLETSKRYPSVEEMLGYVDALLDLAVPLRSLVAVDLCGTGGDMKGTFNISTAASFALAALDVPVAKHGNGAASSKCGSSDVLRALGVNIPETPEGVDQQFKKANLVFLHAPFFQPALKRIAGIRKELGIKTIFNLLGPIASPVRPTYQMVGVSDPKLMGVYSEVLTELKRDHVIVHTKGGYDEIGLTAESFVITGGFETTLTPDEFGITVSEEDLKGGETPEENARLIREILSGNGTPSQTAVVAVNAAVAAKLYYPEESYHALYERAAETLTGGSALDKLELSLA